MSFRLVDHTADLILESQGRTREEALSEAGVALTAVVTGRKQMPLAGAPAREVGFELEAPDLPALAVAFLSELLWLLESEDVLWVGGGVRIEEGPAEPITGPVRGSVQTIRMVRLVAAGNGVTYDPARHGRGVEVKAVTYHGLEFAPVQAGWRLKVLLDI